MLTSVLAACGSSDNKQASGAEGGTRVVQDEFGEVTIPVKPQRVAGIYVEDYLMALGVTPVVQWYNPTWGKQDYLNLDVPLFDNTGSVEALLAHEPDLIIVDGGVDAARYEQYAKVAPTYRLPESILQNPKDVLETIGDLLGIPEKSESILADFDAKVADAKAKLEKSVGRETVAFIRINTGDKTIALFGIKNRYVGDTLYNQLGLEPHPLVKNMEAFQEILSEEAFTTLDADHIIVIPSNGDWNSPENAEAFKLLDSPFWRKVPAFANNHVYKAERSHWQSGAITASGMKIDDMLRFMAE